MFMKLTEKIDKISVFGGLEGVLKDLVKSSIGDNGLEASLMIEWE